MSLFRRKMQVKVYLKTERGDRQIKAMTLLLRKRYNLEVFEIAIDASRAVIVEVRKSRFLNG